MDPVMTPVIINGIEFDALISEDLSYSSTVPSYPVEKGFSVTDSILLEPEALSMSLFVTNTPVTWYARHGASTSRVKEITEMLENLYFSSTPVTIITNDRIYTDMAIESLTLSKSSDTGRGAKEIPISFKKIHVTESKTTTIPDSYGKSGNSKSSSGTSNTSKGSSSGGNSSGSGSGSSSEGSGKKSSILYGIGESCGLTGGDSGSSSSGGGRGNNREQ